MDSSFYWNRKLPDNYMKASYDSWLEDYKDVFSMNDMVLDLGCGNGEDTEWLIHNGYNVISVDISSAGIARVSRKNPNSFLFDMSNIDEWQKLKTGYFDVVVANLSLHYFDDKTTKIILYEIRRVLKKNGVLLARVNTTDNKEFGSGSGIKLETDFYQNYERGITKRFFTKDSVDYYFSIVGDVKIKHKTIKYTGIAKNIFEIIAYKR